MKQPCTFSFQLFQLLVFQSRTKSRLEIQHCKLDLLAGTLHALESFFHLPAGVKYVMFEEAFFNAAVRDD